MYSRKRNPSLQIDGCGLPLAARLAREGRCMSLVGGRPAVGHTPGPSRPVTFTSRLDKRTKATSRFPAARGRRRKGRCCATFGVRRCWQPVLPPWHVVSLRQAPAADAPLHWAAHRRGATAQQGRPQERREATGRRCCDGGAPLAASGGRGEEAGAGTAATAARSHGGRLRRTACCEPEDCGRHHGAQDRPGIGPASTRGAAQGNGAVADGAVQAGPCADRSGASGGLSEADERVRTWLLKPPRTSCQADSSVVGWRRTAVPLALSVSLGGSELTVSPIARDPAQSSADDAAGGDRTTWKAACWKSAQLRLRGSATA